MFDPEGRHQRLYRFSQTAPLDFGFALTGDEPAIATRWIADQAPFLHGLKRVPKVIYSLKT